MSRHDEHSVPPDLQEIARRLEAERPQASDLELDRVKLKAMNAASRSTVPARPRLGQLFRSGRLATLSLAIVLMVGGGAVLAKNDGPSKASNSKSSSNSEYCPDSSQQPGKPKDPGPSKCGKPKTK
jgi:hypothetical protein